MASVLNYQAGYESTNTAISYGLETTWATLPATTFQGMRILSESLKHTKTRTRPGEIRGDRQAAPGLTTQENASGSIVFPVYYASSGKPSAFDDFMSCLFGGVWTGDVLKNGLDFRTVYIQQRIDPAATATKWFRYPGSYPTRAQLTLSLGQFLQATVDFASQQELAATADASTGGIIAAPDTLEFDPVGGFLGIYVDDVLLSSACDQFTMTFENQGAAGQYGLGSALAQGMLGGTFLASGDFRIYIKSLDLYNDFRAETYRKVSIRTGDQDGNYYDITLPKAVLLLNNGINAEGPNRSLMGEFTLESSPDPITGCTAMITRAVSAY
jgi:hypothetical protein